ncbi:hypothetical protein AAFH68_06940 [Flavobacterium sp. CGRL1]
MAENSKIKITASGSVSNDEGQYIKFKDIAVTGSKSHDFYTKETAFKAELDKDYAAYHVGIDELSNKVGKARKEGNKKSFRFTLRN